MDPDREDLETGCSDGVCDGVAEDEGVDSVCPVTITPQRGGLPSRQTLIAIEPDLESGEFCITTFYVKLREGANIRSCPTADLDDGSLDYNFPFNDGVQIFDADNELLGGPFDAIRLMPVGCPDGDD